MTEALNQELAKMDDCQFNQLQRRVYIANQIRKTQHNYNLDNLEFGVRTGIKPDILIKMRNAAYNYSALETAKIETFMQELAAEAIRKKQILEFAKADKTYEKKE